MLIIHSALSIGESVKRLLAPHNAATFFSDGGINRFFLAYERAFSTRFPPVLKFNVFNGVKYLYHTFKYLKRPAIMESPSKKGFIN